MLHRILFIIDLPDTFVDLGSISRFLLPTYLHLNGRFPGKPGLDGPLRFFHVFWKRTFWVTGFLLLTDFYAHSHNARTNLLISKFGKCSYMVKKLLFKSYCLSMYNLGLWKYYNETVFNKFKLCYNRCVEKIFRFSKT